MKIDPRFGDLHSSPEFQRLTADLEAKVARMRREAERTLVVPVKLADDPTGAVVKER